MAIYFRDWIFNRLPRYFQRTDTYIDGAGNGLLKRYLRVHGDELDVEFMPYIDKFADLQDFIKADDKYLPLIGGILGYPPSVDGLNSTYRKMLAYAVAIYKVKGSIRSFEILFNLIGLSITIQEEVPKKATTYDLEPPVEYDNDDDEYTYDQDCDMCSGYNITYVPRTGIVVNAALLAAAQNIVNFLNPINATFLGFIAGAAQVLGLTIVPTNNSANVSWPQVAGASVYRVRTSPDNGASSNSTSWVNDPPRNINITGLSGATNYWVEVLPYDNNNDPMNAYNSGWVMYTTL